MAVPLAHAEEKAKKEEDEGRSATLRHIRTEKEERGKERKKKKEEGRGLPSVVEAGV